MEEGRDATLHEWYESYLSRFLLQKWYFSINKKKFVLQKNLYQILIRNSPPLSPVGSSIETSISLKFSLSFPLKYI